MTVWLPNKKARPRLNGAELWIVYRLVDREYWRKRNRGRTDDRGFQMLSRLRKKLLKNLNECRENRYGVISIKERVW